MNEISNYDEREIQSPNGNPDIEMSPESVNAMRDLFKDDFEGLVENADKTNNISQKNDPEQVMKNLFADDYEDRTSDSGNSNISFETEQQEIVDYEKQYEPNSKVEINGHVYETDDKGYIFKIDGYELKPNCEYIIDGIKYKTDERGRIVSCEGETKLTPDGERDLKAQSVAGGEDRKDGDQGGHIIARILGGAKGIENMLAMRGPINQGPYSHIMEKEISDALKEGKAVHIYIEISYDGDSKRPAIIKVSYVIDGKKTEMEYDNNEGSTRLLDSIEEKVDKDEFNDLKNEINDANKDGTKISIIAVKTEYNEDGSIKKVIVIMRDENGEPPQNEHRTISPKDGDK